MADAWICGGQAQNGVQGAVGGAMHGISYRGTRRIRRHAIGRDCVRGIAVHRHRVSRCDRNPRDGNYLRRATLLSPSPLGPHRESSTSRHAALATTRKRRRPPRPSPPTPAPPHRVLQPGHPRGQARPLLLPHGRQRRATFTDPARVC